MLCFDRQVCDVVILVLFLSFMVLIDYLGMKKQLKVVLTVYRMMDFPTRVLCLRSVFGIFRN